MPPPSFQVVKLETPVHPCHFCLSDSQCSMDLKTLLFPLLEISPIHILPLLHLLHLAICTGASKHLLTKTKLKILPASGDILGFHFLLSSILSRSTLQDLGLHPGLPPTPDPIPWPTVHQVLWIDLPEHFGAIHPRHSVFTAATLSQDTLIYPLDPRNDLSAPLGSTLLPWLHCLQPSQGTFPTINLMEPLPGWKSSVTSLCPGKWRKSSHLHLGGSAAPPLIPAPWCLPRAPATPAAPQGLPTFFPLNSPLRIYQYLRLAYLLVCTSQVLSEYLWNKWMDERMNQSRKAPGWWKVNSSKKMADLRRRKPYAESLRLRWLWFIAIKPESRKGTLFLTNCHDASP